MSDRVVRAALRAIVLATCALLSDTPPLRPDVIVIVMDTTRADRCSFQGYARRTTPRLDEFAKDAVVFRDAWSPSGWTAPAHASLFTGLLPENHLLNGQVRSFLDDEFVTVAERLRDKGWATACFSNNLMVSPEFGLIQGFEHYVEASWDRPYPWARPTHEMAAQWAEEQRRAGRPFFLFVNDMEPHMPYAPPREAERLFVRGRPSAAELDDARAFVPPRPVRYAAGTEKVTARQIELLSDLYDAEIATLDAEIGRLFDRLRAAGILDSALVVVTADHGEYFGEHRMLEHGRGVHRPACQVPLLVRFPGVFAGGRVVDSVVRLEDVPPTILELAGLPVPPGLDGLTLTQGLAGRVARAFEGTDPAVVEKLRKEAPGGDVARLAAGVRAVHDGRHRLLDYTDGRVELFDMREDPAETRNLAPSEPGIVARLRALLSR